jgi:hypothetical protein
MSLKSWKVSERPRKACLKSVQCLKLLLEIIVRNYCLKLLFEIIVFFDNCCFFIYNRCFALERPSWTDAILNIVSDGLGNMDFSRTSGCSKTKIQKKVIGEMMRESNKKQTAMFHRKDIEAICQKCGLAGDIKNQFDGNYYNLLDMLNEQNYLLKKGKGMYLLVGSKFQKSGRGNNNRG